MTFEEALAEMKNGRAIKIFDIKYRIRDGFIENPTIINSMNFFLEKSTKIKDKFDIYPEYINNTSILSDE